jgi:hypothetical protein
VAVGARFMFVFLISSCAVAPFATDHSALPLGRGNNLIETGLSPAPYVQYMAGVTKDLDLGLGAELQLGYSLYVYGKYSIIKPKNEFGEGFAMAMIAGAGIGLSVIETQFLYVGPIVSYQVNDFEFYFHPRFNHLRYSEYDPNGNDDPNDEDDLDGFEIGGGSFNYVLLAAGGQYWVSERFAFGLGLVSLPPAPGDSFSTSPAVNFIFHF